MQAKRLHAFEVHYLVGQHERKLIMYLLDMCMSYSISLQPIMAPERPYVLPHNYTISFIIITYNKSKLLLDI